MPQAPLALPLCSNLLARKIKPNTLSRPPICVQGIASSSCLDQAVPSPGPQRAAASTPQGQAGLPLILVM